MHCLLLTSYNTASVANTASSRSWIDSLSNGPYEIFPAEVGRRRRVGHRAWLLNLPIRLVHPFAQTGVFQSAVHLYLHYIYGWLTAGCMTQAANLRVAIVRLMELIVQGSDRIIIHMSLLCPPPTFKTMFVFHILVFLLVEGRLPRLRHVKRYIASYTFLFLGRCFRARQRLITFVKLYPMFFGRCLRARHF